MPRYARIHVPSGLFHIISRFQDRQFHLDLDGARAKYLELLGQALETHDCRLIAYLIGVVMADRPKSVLVHTETYGMELSRKETLQVNRIAKSFSEGESSEQLSEKVRLKSRRSKTGKASVFVLRRNRKRK